MGIGDRIAGARADRGWSQIKLAKAVGQAQTTISSWERGRTEPTREDVQRVATALDVPVAQLESHDPSSPAERRTVPVVGYVGAGAVAHYYATGQGELDRVDMPDKGSTSTVAAEIRGDSLGPVLEGWLVYWDDVRNPVTPDLHGRLCVVGLPNDQVLVKKLQATNTPNHFHLISNSAEAPMFDREVLWAARVISMTPR
jgi:transcriptional regulator with XRE-family HTH domain